MAEKRAGRRGTELHADSTGTGLYADNIAKIMLQNNNYNDILKIKTGVIYAKK